MVADDWHVIKEFGDLQRFGPSPTGFNLTGTGVISDPIFTCALSAPQVQTGDECGMSLNYWMPGATAPQVTSFHHIAYSIGYIEATLSDCAGATHFTVRLIESRLEIRHKRRSAASIPFVSSIGNRRMGQVL